MQLLDHLLRFKTQNTCLLPLASDDKGYLELLLGYSLDNFYENTFWLWPRRIRCSVLVPAILNKSWAALDRLLEAGYKPDRLSLLAAVLVSKTHGLAYIWKPEKIAALEKDTLSLVRRVAELLNPHDISQPARRRLPTPLQMAVKGRRPDIARLLISLGADVNAPCPKGLGNRWAESVERVRTALQAAVELGDLEMIDLLLDAGADVNAPPGRACGATALQLAAGNGHIGIAQKLVGLGADVNAAGARREGRTALEMAAGRGRLDMVRFLLECGAGTAESESFELRAAYRRACSLAEESGHLAVYYMLRGHCEDLEETSGADQSTLSGDGSDSDDERRYYSSEDESGEGNDDEGYRKLWVQ